MGKNLVGIFSLSRSGNSGKKRQNSHKKKRQRKGTNSSQRIVNGREGGDRTFKKERLNQY